MTLLTVTRARDILKPMALRLQIHALWFYSRMTRGENVQSVFKHNAIRVFSVLVQDGKSERLRNAAAREYDRVIRLGAPDDPQPPPAAQGFETRDGVEAPERSVPTLL